MRKWTAGIVVAGAIFGTLGIGVADVRELEARPGAAFKMHVFEAPDPIASIVMLEGASGVFSPGGVGFVSGHYHTFVGKGFSVAVVEPPKDQRDKFNGFHPRFRGTPAHVHDLAAAVDAIRSDVGKPVWLLGISRGSLSVANFVGERPDLIDGAVFMSSSTNTPRGFKSVLDYDLSRMPGPVLAVAHEDDGCRGTPPSGARRIADAARRSRAAEAMYFDGGNVVGKSPCGSGSPHVFSGLEDDVVARVAEFIAAHAR